MMDAVGRGQERGPEDGVGAARAAVDKLIRGGLLDELMAQVDEGSLQLTGEGGFSAGVGEAGVGGRFGRGAD